MKTVLSLVLFIITTGAFAQNWDIDPMEIVSDTIMTDSVIKISYTHKIRNSSFSWHLKATDSGFVADGPCFYKEANGKSVSGSYIDGRMTGEWVERNKRGVLIQRVNYDFEGTQISNDSLLFEDNVLIDKDSNVFYVSEYMPRFGPGDHSYFKTYIEKNIFNPPSFRFFGGEKDFAYVGFVVHTNGDVVNATIAKSAIKDLETEALRIVNSSPKWDTSLPRGKPYDVKFVYKVVFTNNH